jgi:hypothetical protein
MRLKWRGGIEWCWLTLVTGHQLQERLTCRVCPGCVGLHVCKRTDTVFWGDTDFCILSVMAFVPVAVHFADCCWGVRGLMWCAGCVIAPKLHSIDLRRSQTPKLHSIDLRRSQTKPKATEQPCKQGVDWPHPYEHTAASRLLLGSVFGKEHQADHISLFDTVPLRPCSIVYIY